MDKEDNAFEDFRGWWFAPEQDGLRLNVAEGNGFRIWLASRSVIEIELPELAVDHDERLLVETSVEGAFNLGVIRSYQSIKEHGIRIKRVTK